MAVRRESVVLDLDDHLSPGMLRAAAATGVLDESLGRLDGHAVGASRSLSRVESDADSLGRSLDKNGPSIDRYSGRLGILVDAGLALGPALATSAAVAVPAVTALAGEVGFLVAGVGTGVLAFHGLGDALKKFDQASLDPTAEHIKAAQDALDGLPPSAQRLVLELHQLEPLLDRLRQSAARGLVPGVSSGLRDLIGDAPLAQKALRGIGFELGDLARDAGRSLSSDEWRPFLRFLGREAPVSIDATARSVGHVTHGLAEMWMAFEPVNRNVDQGILRLAQDFDQWATSLGRTKGFEDFLDYVNQNGPRVLDLLGQIAVTGVDIGRAIAPLGGPTIEILTDLLKLLDGIANSDLGTPLFGALVAFRLYARGMQALGVQVETSWKGIAAAPGQLSTQTSKLATSVRASTTSITSDLRSMATEYAADTRTIQSASRPLFSNNPLGMASTYRATEKTTKGIGKFRSTALAMLSQTSEASQRTKARLGELAKGGAIAAGVAVVASGAANKVGLTNTTSLALAGSLAGPVGTAVGGAVGFTLDLAHANDSLVDSLHRVQQAYKGGGVTVSFAAQAATLQDLRTQTTEAQKTLVDAWTPGGSAGHNPIELTQQGIAAIGDTIFGTSRKTQAAAIDFAHQGALIKTGFTEIFSGLTKNKQSGGAFVELTSGQLQAAANRAQPAMLALGITVDDLKAAADAGDGSLERMTGRIVDWINRSESAGAKTKAVAAAFAQMGDDTLTTDQRVQALSDSLDALLGPTLGLSAATDQYTRDLHTLRSELDKHNKTLVGNTNAALTNRAAIRSRVTDLANMIKAEAQAGASPEKLTHTLKSQRQALIDAGAAAGISRKEMGDYLDQLGLTPKLVRTAIELSGVDQAAGQLNRLRQNLQGLKDRTIHITVKTDHLGAIDTTGTGGHVLTGHAGGGTVPGQRHPYGDKVLIHAAPGEEVITNRNGEADQFRADRASGRIPAYASGGTVAAGVGFSGADTGDNGVSRGLRELRRELARSKQAIADERQARQSLVDKERQLVSTVQDQFRTDVFSSDSSGIWGSSGGFDPIGGLRDDITDAKSFNKDLHRLRRLGLSRGAFMSLASSGNVAGADSLAHDSRAQIRRLSRLYRERQQVSHQVGAYAGNVGYGDAEQVVAERLGDLERQLREANQHLKRLERTTAHDGPRNTARHLNSAAGKGARSVRRGA